MSRDVKDLPLATLLTVAENTFAGVTTAVTLPVEKRFKGREKGSCPPGQFAVSVQIPLCVAFLKELKRRGIPIDEQEWLIEEFDAFQALTPTPLTDKV